MSISPAQSDLLNLARWTAAWLVLVEHARSLMFIDYNQIDDPTVWLKFFYFISGFGHEAVVVFFVISGFLVGGKVVTDLSRRQFKWRQFLLNRFSRLYAVLGAALVLGALFDIGGLHLFDTFGLYDKSFAGTIAVLSYDVSTRMNAETFFGNALFLQGIAVEPFGSNAPLWSLAYEWWYYLLWPAGLSIFLGTTSSARLLGFAVTLAILLMIPRQMLVLFGVWVLGALASLPSRAMLSSLVSVVFFIGTLVFARLEISKVPALSDYLIGIAFAMLLISRTTKNTRLPLRHLSLYLSEFSYSLYLVHFPTIMLLITGLYWYSGWGIKEQPSVNNLLGYFLVVSFSLATAWAVAQFTEARTLEFRNYLYRLTRLTNSG